MSALPISTADPHVPVPAAAATISVTPATVYRWIRTGQLRAYRYGPRSIRVDLAELRAVGRGDTATATEDHVQQLVNEAPALTESQKATLSRILGATPAGGAGLE